MRNRIAIGMLAGAALLAAPAWAQSGAPAGDAPLRVALITGGHGFREEPFFDMFKAMKSIRFEHFKYGEGAEAKFKPEAARNFDVFVFYDMNQDCKAFVKDLLAMFEAGKPGVFLHHALGSCPLDEEYSAMRAEGLGSRSRRRSRSSRGRGIIRTRRTGPRYRSSIRSRRGWRISISWMRRIRTTW